MPPPPAWSKVDRLAAQHQRRLPDRRRRGRMGVHGPADLVERRLERERQAELGDQVRRAVSYYMATDELAVALLGHHHHETLRVPRRNQPPERRERALRHLDRDPP